MDQTSTTSPDPSRRQRETYGLRNSDFQRSMVMRSAQRQAAFLLPHLRPGMNLLDCGCGPGSITTDFARLLAPGEVTGLDIDPGEIERATARALELGLENVHFRTGDIYQLPFAAETFDIVYSNALLDHLRDPIAALRETYRVLKAGGIAAIRTADRDGYYFYPSDPVLEKDLRDGEAEKAAQGISVRIGKQIRSLLRQAGFVRTEASASYDSYGTSESVRRLAANAASDEPDNEIAAAWKRWGDSPDAFFGHAFCEGLGWKQ